MVNVCFKHSGPQLISTGKNLLAKLMHFGKDASDHLEDLIFSVKNIKRGPESAVS